VLIHVLIVILSVVEALCGILLVAIILLQKSKSHGAAAGLAFGAGMGESLFGAQATNILQKITVVLTTIFLVNTTLLAVLGGQRHRGGSRSVTDSLPSAPPPVESPAPIQGAPPAEMPPVGPTAPAIPSSGGGAQPIKIDTPVPVPAPAPAPAPGTDAGQKPAQP